MVRSKSDHARSSMKLPRSLTFRSLRVLTPGPISGMPAFQVALSGAELIPIAIPQFGVVGSNWALPVVMLATAILGAYPLRRERR